MGCIPYSATFVILVGQVQLALSDHDFVSSSVQVSPLTGTKEKEHHFVGIIKHELYLLYPLSIWGIWNAAGVCTIVA
jgi:hypothetical protein